MIHAVQPGTDAFRELSASTRNVPIVRPLPSATLASALPKAPRDLRPESFDGEICAGDADPWIEQADGLTPVLARKGVHRPCRVGLSLLCRHHRGVWWSRFKRWTRRGKPVEQGRK